MTTVGGESTWVEVMSWASATPVRQFTLGGVIPEQPRPCACGHLPRNHSTEPGRGCTTRPCFCLHPTGLPLR